MELHWKLYLILGFSIRAECVEITISGGKILGRTAKTISLGRDYTAFLGIPYAEPPERFELAKPKLPWRGVLNCTYDKSQCVQGSNPVLGSEDCLFLSVYSPDINGNLPVLVWVHGGYFIEGNSSYRLQGPDYLVEEGIVFVQLNYRLGVFGFLSTGDLVCPGNLGFKDQLLALQWVQQNIKYFGGDSTKVTLGGQSAGAAAVSLHLQSPKSKGLFRGIILNSGSSLSGWTHNIRAKEILNLLAFRFGYFTLNSTEIIQGFKKLSYESLQSISTLISTKVAAQNPLHGIYYGYVSEPDHPEAFFTGKSEHLLSKGNFTKVPVLLGFNSNEGMFVGQLSIVKRIYLILYDVFLFNLVPTDFTSNIFHKILAALSIKSHFFGLLSIIGAQSDAKIFRFVTADQWVRPTRRFAIDVSKFIKEVYFYQFSYMGKLGLAGAPRIDAGVKHGEDLYYIFSIFPNNPTPEETVIRQRIVRLWSNYIKYLNPTPEPDPLLQNVMWPIFSGNDIPGVYNYYNIDSNMSLITDTYNEDIIFYEKLFQKYGDGLYSTY